MDNNEISKKESEQVQEIKKEDIDNSSPGNEADNKIANKLCIISLILATITAPLMNVLSPYNMKIFSYLESMCFLAGLVLAIVAKVKYPKNVFAKVLFWIYICLVIIGIIMGVVMTVVLVISCAHEIESGGCAGVY